MTEAFLERCEQLNLIRIQRSSLGRRLERDDEERLQTILKGLRLGFTLSEMKVLLDAFWRSTRT